MSELTTVIVPRDLFERAGLGQLSSRVPRARRLLVTLWVVAGGESASREHLARVRRVWEVADHELTRAARVTVLTALLQLQSVGLVKSINETEGGYAVELRKEATS